MELEEALTVWVGTVPSLVARIGEPNRLRLYKLKLEQKTRMPSTVLQRSGADRQYRPCTVDGAVALSLQVDHYAKTWQSMVDLAKAWREALSPNAVSYPIWMGGAPDDSPLVAVKVKAATLDNEFDLDDPDPGLLRRSQSWTFWVWEP